MNVIDVDGNKDNKPIHTWLDWMYPNIYNKRERSTLTIDLCHVRAADPIRISYCGDRDGWIIEQSSSYEGDRDWKEVAFIKAWEGDKK